MGILHILLMPQNVSPEQFKTLYEKLPEGLQKTISAMSTASAIEQASDKYGVPPEKIPLVAQNVRDVLLGLTMPEEFEASLKKDLGLGEEETKQMARELNRYLFYPVKPELEQLHRLEIEVTAKVVTPGPQQAPPEEDNTPPRSGNDPYKESIE